MKERPVVVVGGGISGLTLARDLCRGGEAVLLLEADRRFGGVIRTECHDGFLYDVGPDSFLKTKPDAIELCRELELEGELITPQPAVTQVYVAFEGALHPLPEGLALGVPTRLSALLDTPLLSDLGKARALLEPFVPRRGHQGEESILGFMSRRLGPEMAERIAAPLLSGVFAGDAERLSMDAAFPQLVELERTHGSLFLGLTGASSLWAALLKPKKPTESPFVSLRRGLGRLIERLVEELPAACLQPGASVDRLEARADGALVHVGGETIHARHVVVAGAPWLAARLVQGVSDTLASQLTSVRGAPTATVFFAVSTDGLERRLSGSGFIVPPGEGEILAATWVSSKWQERAPSGGTLIRAFVGGARGDGVDISSMTDDALERLAHRELERLMGRLGPLRFARVYRYARGTPQPDLGQRARLGDLERELARLPWLSLAGMGYGGVGIPDSVRRARAVAARLLASKTG